MLKGDDKNNTIKMSAGSQNSALLEAESASINNNDFITNDQTNKIIQDLNSYSNDKEISLNNIDDFRNNLGIIQIYSSGFGD